MDFTSVAASDVGIRLPATGLQVFLLPRAAALDTDLCNLRRAYDLPLDVQDLHHPEPEEDEQDLIDGHHPLEFCESQILEEDDDESSSQSSEHQYKCGFCFYEGTILQLQNHMMYFHQGDQVRTHWCGRCRLNFENETVFKQHQLQEHFFCCLQCGKSFKRRRLLIAHLPLHSEEKSFKCPTCEKIFFAQRYFVRHLERHDKKHEVREEAKDRIYKCTVCEKDFTKKESLAKHARIHTRESFKCSVCGYTCGKKVTMKMHIISHEGNRKYKCGRCDFSFKQIGHLKRHKERFNHK